MNMSGLPRAEAMVHWMLRGAQAGLLVLACSGRVPGQAARLILSAALSIGLAGQLPTASAQGRDKAAGALEIAPQLGHTGEVRSIAFFPDGRALASASYDGTVKIWDTTSGTLVRNLAAHDKYASSVAVSADGRRLVSGGWDNRVKVWDTSSWKVLFVLAQGEFVQTVAISPDGKKLVSGGDGGLVKLWSLETGKLIAGAKMPNDNAGVVAFTPDSQTFLVGGNYAGTMQLYDAATGRLLKTAAGQSRTISGNVHRDSIYSMTVLPDGRRAVIGGVGWSSRLWDISSWKPAGDAPAVRSALALQWLDGGKRFAAATYDRKLYVIDSAGTGNVKQFDHDGEAGSVALSPDGRILASASRKGQLHLVSLTPDGDATLTSTFRLDATGGANNREIRTIAVAPAGDVVLARTYNDLSTWEIRTGRLAPRQLKLEGQGGALAFSPEGRNIYFSTEKKVNSLTVASGNAAWNADAPFYSREIAPFKDGGRLAVAEGYNGFAVRNAADGQVIFAIDYGKKFSKGNNDNRAADSIDVAPDAKELVTGDLDNAIRFWDTNRGDLLRSITTRQSVRRVRFSPDGSLIAASMSDGSVGIFGTGGKAVKDLRAHDRDAAALSFSPDGKLLASGGADGLVKLWDTRSWASLRVLSGHSGAVTSIAFTPDGRTLVSSSSDQTVRLWNAATGALLATSIRHFGMDEWVTLTPEGFFDASPGGARLLTLVDGLHAVSIDQFRDALFRPDLVKAKLAGDPDGVVKAAAAKLDLNKVVESGKAPRVAIASPADGSSVARGEVNFEALVTEQGGGIGRIEWRLNGQPVGIETRGFQRVQDGAATPSPAVSGPSETASRISQKMVLDAGDNVVELLAYNEKGLVASQPSRVTVKATGPAAVTKPRLFVLAVGVNDYYDSRLRLNYAVPDARAIAAAFEKAGTGFYESVKAVTVIDADVTRANLEKVFARLATEVKTTDVFVFFIAGHGRTLDGHYYFLPQDFKYRDQNSYAENGLSQQQWQKWITTVQARKSVLIYDTCESGAVTADPVVMASNTRGLQRVEEQAVAYDKLRDAMGKTILAASTDTQPALEGYRGHGVFSYVVMEALEKAQTNAGGLIEVTGLISYIDDKVPDLSFQAFKQRQIPQNKLTGSNFAIAKPTTMSLGTGPAQAPPTPGANAVSTKPTHVVIAPADVFEKFGGQGTATQQLRPGTLLSLVRTEQGWMLVAKDGKTVGYVAEGKITQIQ